MAVEVILPKVDMDMETGQISRWYAKNGDKVEKGQLLFEIETDKAAMEVDCPASGILGSISAAEGEIIPVGQAVAWIYNEGENHHPIDDSKELSSALTAPIIIQEALPQKEKAAQPEQKKGAFSEINDKNVRATPLARRIARNAGLNLQGVEGSGPKGRIQKKDVEGALVTNTSCNSQNLVRAETDKTNHSSKIIGALNASWLRPGDSNLIPVVLIHGFAADLNSWRSFLAGKIIKNPVLSIDLPGHGGSPSFVPKSINDIAIAVEATLAAYSIDTCILVGHSFGGAVATITAARAMIDVRSLVLISSAGLGPEINGAFIKGVTTAKSECSLKPWLYQLVSNQTFITKTFINASVEQLQNQTMRYIQATIGELFFTDSTQVFEIRSLFESLTIPIRLIFGSDDHIIPVAHSRGLPGKVGIHIFSHCGHLPHVEESVAVFDILEQCVSAVS